MTVNFPIALNWANNTVIEVNNLTGAPVTVPLPSAPSTGEVVIVKDWAGNASIYNITVLGTIDGSTNYVMSNNYQALMLYWDNIRWNIF